jgi:SAM-dependent methyltransferase
LDVACGTGLVARIAAECVGMQGRVMGLDILPAMLAVARAIPQGCGAQIQWQEGDAAALRFPDGTFDVVFCHQGLQFFSDRRAALGEIRRVLAPGGRVALAVWSRIERNPYFFFLAAAVERRVGTEAARQMRSSFALGDAHKLRSLVSGAGFGNAEVRTLVKPVRLPPVVDFVPRHLAGTSLAPVVAALDVATRTALSTDVAIGLQQYEDKNGLSLPFETHLVLSH